MKNILLTLLVAVSIGAVASAQEYAKKKIKFIDRGGNPVYATVEEGVVEPAKSLFNGKEWRLLTYMASDMEGITDGTKVSTGFGGDYFFTKSFGIGARAELDDFDGTVIEDTLGRITIRAPLWDKIAPYGYVEGGYSWDNSDWTGGLGAGAEYRFNNGIGLFAEAGLRLRAGGPDKSTKNNAERRPAFPNDTVRPATDRNDLVVRTKDERVVGDFRFVAGISYSF